MGMGMAPPCREVDGRGRCWSMHSRDRRSLRRSLGDRCRGKCSLQRLQMEDSSAEPPECGVEYGYRFTQSTVQSCPIGQGCEHSQIQDQIFHACPLPQHPDSSHASQVQAYMALDKSPSRLAPPPMEIGVENRSAIVLRLSCMADLTRGYVECRESR